jgi:hypothetical protein
MFPLPPNYLPALISAVLDLGHVEPSGTCPSVITNLERKIVCFREGGNVNGINTFFNGDSDAVPEVKFADLKAMWNYNQEIKSRDHRRQFAVADSVWERICSPDANIPALTYRCTMLSLLETFLEATVSGGQITDNALQVAATIPMNWVGMGMRNLMPFDFMEFLTLVRGKSIGILAN